MITRETGTGRFTNLVVRQTIAPLAFVDIFLAVVMALQPSSVQAGMKAATEMVDSALVFAVDVSESINTERYALPWSIAIALPVHSYLTNTWGSSAFYNVTKVLAFDNVVGANDAGANPIIAGVGETLVSTFFIAAHGLEDFRSDEVMRFAILVDTIVLHVREPRAPVMQMLAL